MRRASDTSRFIGSTIQEARASELPALRGARGAMAFGGEAVPARGVRTTRPSHRRARVAFPNAGPARHHVAVAEVRVRQAVNADASALRDLFRRSSLSSVGDRASLLAHPDALEFSGEALREHRV